MKKDCFTEINQLPILLNAEEVAMALRISRAHGYALMHSSCVNCVRIGKRILLPKKELLKYIGEDE